jgi:hypothetical protein
VAGENRFKLEFQLRGESSDEGVYETVVLPKRFGEARETIEKFYGRKPANDVDPREVKNIVRSLEAILGGRDSWSLPVLRELWGALWAGAGKRRRSADHERLWLMLAGYTLRPGFGASLDDWRSRETFSIFPQGLQFHQDKPAWDQWWILWRRIAGGLDETAQTTLVEAMRPYLEPVVPGKTKPRPKGPKFEGIEEMVRLAGSLERLPVTLKGELADWLWSRLGSNVPGGNTWWAIGRLGSRVPFYGSAHQVIRPELAGEWLERLFKLEWSAHGGASFAAVLLARATGDRVRDVSEELRLRVVERLERIKAPPPWIQMVREPIELGEADEQRIFGDSLPVGLKLVQ